MKALGKTLAGLGAVSVAAWLGYSLYERNTEEPAYHLLRKDGHFEVRSYPSLLVAEALEDGSREEALNRGFRALADYIFAKSRGGRKIPMTTPVIQDRQKIPMTAPVLQDKRGAGSWRTRFVMPATYTRETLPAPPPGVTIDETPPRDVAVVRFSGRADDRAISRKESELRIWMLANDLEPSGSPEYAFYNSPFAAPFFRRNEILIPVR